MHYNYEGDASEDLLGIFSSMSLAIKSKIYYYKHNNEFNIQLDNIIIDKINNVKYDFTKKKLYYTLETTYNYNEVITTITEFFDTKEETMHTKNLVCEVDINHQIWPINKHILSYIE